MSQLKWGEMRGKKFQKLILKTSCLLSVTRLCGRLAPVWHHKPQ